MVPPSWAHCNPSCTFDNSSAIRKSARLPSFFKTLHLLRRMEVCSLLWPSCPFLVDAFSSPDQAFGRSCPHVEGNFCKAKRERAQVSVRAMHGLWCAFLPV